MYKLNVTIEGTAPLLMHNERLADPFDDITKRMKVVSANRKKGEDDHEELAQLEFEGGLYFDDDAGPYIPGKNLQSMLVYAARRMKLGKEFEAGVRICDEVNPLTYTGPRTVAGLYQDRKFRDRRGIGVQGKRIFRTRPKFKAWAVTFDVQVTADSVSLEIAQNVLEIAGQYQGLGDYRPLFGQFAVKSVKKT